MSTVVYCLAPNEAVAIRIADRLYQSGFAASDISAVQPTPRGVSEIRHDNSTKAPEGAAAGASAGALLGGALGWAAGIGALAIPGVGPRTAEAVVAYVDKPERFGNGAQVASYFGLAPSLDQSGRSVRYGRITKGGPATVRKLLVEASWQVIRHNPAMKKFYERVKAGKNERTGRALVAVARRLVEIMAAMLKSGEVWRNRASSARASSRECWLEIAEGRLTPVTFSRPSASAAITATTAESMPPLSATCAVRKPDLCA